MPNTLWVFDNDGVLYNDALAHQQFMPLFYEYCAGKLKLPVAEVEQQVKALKQKHQTQFSIIAVIKEYGLSLDELIAATYAKIDLSLCDISSPDTIRRKILESIAAPKVVFTNNPASYARRVLTLAGTANLFIDIVGMEQLGMVSKPSAEAYIILETLHPGYENYVFCDDSLANLDAAARRGWDTIWLKPANAPFQPRLYHSVISSFTKLLSYQRRGD